MDNPSNSFLILLVCSLCFQPQLKLGGAGQTHRPLLILLWYAAGTQGVPLCLDQTLVLHQYQFWSHFQKKQRQPLLWGNFDGLFLQGARYLANQVLQSSGELLKWMPFLVGTCQARRRLAQRSETLAAFAEAKAVWMAYLNNLPACYLFKNYPALLSLRSWASRLPARAVLKSWAWPKLLSTWSWCLLSRLPWGASQRGCLRNFFERAGLQPILYRGYFLMHICALCLASPFSQRSPTTSWHPLWISALLLATSSWTMKGGRLSPEGRYLARSFVVSAALRLCVKGSALINN